MPISNHSSNLNFVFYETAWSANPCAERKWTGSIYFLKWTYIFYGTYFECLVNTYCFDIKFVTSQTKSYCKCGHATKFW